MKAMEDCRVMLEVSNLTKKYKRLVANDHICFQVAPGEIAAWPEWSGKEHCH